jgi:hypothetical protein
MKRLVKTLTGENGQLYTVQDGNRVLLANCIPRLEIYEEITPIPVKGRRGVVKKRHISLVLCGEAEMTREVDTGFFRTVKRFDLSADFQRMDGVFETLFFDALIPVEIDLDGDWRFEALDNPELLKKALTQF